MLVSDVAIVNGFFVWPKMLPAAMLLAAPALVITPLWTRACGATLGGGAARGALLALAMLAHGASIFGVIPLVLIAAYRGLPSWRWIGVAAAGRHRADGAPGRPTRSTTTRPGNRLIKWHSRPASPKSTTAASPETIVDSYREAGLGGTIDNKWNNVQDITGIARDEDIEHVVDFAGEGDTSEAIVWVRIYRFFDLLPMLGLLLIGPIAMAIRRRHRESEADWSFALIGFAFAGIGCFFWALLQWGKKYEPARRRRATYCARNSPTARGLSAAVPFLSSPCGTPASRTESTSGSPRLARVGRRWRSR